MAKGLRRVAGGGGGDHSLSLGAGRGSKKRARLRKEGRGGEDGAVWGGAGRGGSAPQGQGGRLFARCAGGRSPALSGLAGGERRGPSLRPQRRARTGGSACNEGRGLQPAPRPAPPPPRSGATVAAAQSRVPCCRLRTSPDCRTLQTKSCGLWGETRSWRAASPTPAPWEAWSGCLAKSCCHTLCLGSPFPG